MHKKSVRLTYFLLIFIIGLPMVFSAQVTSGRKVALDANGEEINTGQDRTRPVRRFDLRYQYVNFPNSSDRHVVIFRTDRPFRLDKKWIIEARLDVPFMCGTSARKGRRYKRNQFALSDTFMQFIATYQADKRWAYGAGAQFLWPTAYRQCDGFGKYVLSPLVEVHASLPEINPGSFFLFGVCYDFDYAGKKDYRHISALKFLPTFHVMLSKKTFMTFYSNQSITYDFITDSFMWPLDITLGRMLGRSMVTSLEVFIPMIRTKNYKPWDFRIEARVGIFF